MKDNFTFSLVVARTLILYALVVASLFFAGCNYIKAGEVLRGVATVAIADLAVDTLQEYREKEECDISRGDIPIYKAETNEMFCNKKLGGSY